MGDGRCDESLAENDVQCRIEQRPIYNKVYRDDK